MRRSACLLAGVIVFLMAIPAWAHTEFESSTPADQEAVKGPVSEIVVVFTLPVTVVGNGFEVLDPQGRVVSPSVVTDDNATFTLVLAEPLAGGEAGVRYEVTAEDGHVIAGGFSFTVEGSGSSTTTTIPAGTTTNIGEISTSTAVLATTSNPSASPVPDNGGSDWMGLWLGFGAVVLGAVGLYAGMRARS